MEHVQDSQEGRHVLGWGGCVWWLMLGVPELQARVSSGSVLITKPTSQPRSSKLGDENGDLQRPAFPFPDGGVFSSLS